MFNSQLRFLRLLATNLVVAACGDLGNEIDTVNDDTPPDLSATAEQELWTVVYTHPSGIKLVRENTGYGDRGAVYCPTNMVALGGGAFCSDGGLDQTYPIVRYDAGYNLIPVGWAEHHIGASSNDCRLYAVCAPQAWFPNAGDIITRWEASVYGTHTVDCGAGYRVTGGGAQCQFGDLDMTYPTNSALTSWSEYHRGASSNNCGTYAVCVRANTRVGSHLLLQTNRTGYGQGSALCNFPGIGSGIAVGGGSKCTDGDGGDFDYPSDNLDRWIEWHRGRSSYDCVASAVCLMNGF